MIAKLMWIGLLCLPAGPALRDQLGLAEGEGFIVARVVPDSPAAKADIHQHDVLVKVNDKPLESIAQLAGAVNSADGKPLRLALLRGGKPLDVQVTPVERPKKLAERPSGEEPLGELLERVFPDSQMPKLPRNMTLFMPGHPRKIKFPKDLRITITKQGDTPGKIVVEKGDQRWEVTEDSLGELPGEVRRYVEAFLGRFPDRAVRFGEQGRRAISPYLERMRPEVDHAVEQARAKAHRAAKEAREKIEHARQRELDRVNKRLDQLREMIEELQKRIP